METPSESDPVSTNAEGSESFSADNGGARAAGVSSDDTMGRARTGVVHHPLGPHQLAWTAESDRPVLIDGVDWLLWGFCDGELSVAELTQDLVATVDISVDDAAQRVAGARLNLAAAGMIEDTEAMPGAPMDHFPYPPNN